MDEQLAEVLERTRAVYEWTADLDRALQGFVEALVPGFADAVAVITFEPAERSEARVPRSGGRPERWRGRGGRPRVRVPAEAWVEPDRGAAFQDLALHLPGLLDVDHPLMAWLARPRPVLQVECPDLATVLGLPASTPAGLVARAQLGSVLSLPLLRGGAVTGVLVFGHTDGSGRRFGDADLPAAREVALRCSALVETHRLHRDLAEAEGDSERHRLELDHLVDAMPDGFSLISPDLRYLQVNVSCARVLGRERSDLEGQLVAGPVGAGPAQALPAALDSAVRHVLETGEVVRGREVADLDDHAAAAAAAAAAADADGAVAGASTTGRHLVLDLYPVRAGDDVVAVGVLVRDVTERVERERWQQELEAELASAHRLETVAQLAGGVAHDFNNLLAVIGLRTELLLREHGADPVLREGLETIAGAVAQGRDLADQLLRVGRAERAPRERVDVGQLLADLAPVLEATLEADVGFRLELGAAPEVEVPRSALQQAIVNLVVNARDALAGRGTLTVSCGAAERGGRPGCELRVADTGPGMTGAVRDRAFEPFFTTKGVGEGVGLGLATVHGTAQAVGGRAWIESPPGGGCVVAVWIPAAADVGAADVGAGVEVSTDACPRERTGARPEAGAGGRPARLGPILVVEDQPEVASAVAAILRDLDLDPIVATGAVEALALAARVGPLALVITDVVMPGRSGPDLVADLRRAAPGLPALYVSGCTGRGPDGGVPDHELLRKPFTAADLLARVAALLS